MGVRGVFELAGMVYTEGMTSLWIFANGAGNGINWVVPVAIVVMGVVVVMVARGYLKGKSKEMEGVGERAEMDAEALIARARADFLRINNPRYTQPKIFRRVS